MLTFTQPPPPRTQQAKPRKTKIELPVDLNRLVNAIRYDWLAMGEFRKRRVEAVKQMAGARYGANANEQDVPLNLLGLYIELTTAACCSNNPRLMMSTADEKYERHVEIANNWMNREIIRMDAATIFRRVIMDALFWQGLLHIALADAADAEASGWGLKAGQPFMRAIDPGDYVCDQNAPVHERCTYYGYRYRLPVAVANEIHRTAKQEKFEESDQTDLNFGGDDMIQTLSRASGQREEVEPHTTVWEIFSPKHKQIWLLRDGGGIPDETKEPIAVRRWVGPPRGPILRLSLGDLPGNLNPKTKVMDLMPLQENVSSAWRKMLRQTRDYKKVIPFRGQRTDDAKRMQNAKDGELFLCEDPAALAEMEVGGAGNAVWTMAQAMQEGFNFIGGNLALLGGRAAQSRTATQDKLLNENASAGVATIQDRTQTFIESAFREFFWFCWNHPKKVMEDVWSAQSLPELKYPRRLGPWDADEPGMDRREGPMPDVRLDVFSLGRKTPESRMAFMTQVLTQILPIVQLEGAKQGVSIDLPKLITMFSKFGDEPELKKLFVYAEPIAEQAGQGQGGGGGAVKPAETKRTYERISSGGGQNEQSADIDTQMAQLQPGTMNPNSGAG